MTTKATMPSRRETIPSLARWILRIGLCSVAAGPVMILAIFLNDLIKGRSIPEAAGVITDLQPSEILYACAKISLITLPTLLLIAVAMHSLGRSAKDTFMLATGVGAMAGSIAFAVTMSVVLGESLWDLVSGPSSTTDIVLIFLACAMLSALYWVVTIRPRRRARRLHQQDHEAIRAME